MNAEDSNIDSTRDQICKTVKPNKKPSFQHYTQVSIYKRPQVRKNKESMWTTTTLEISGVTKDHMKDIHGPLLMMY